MKLPWIRFIALAALVLGLGVATTAKADIVIEYSTDSGASWTTLATSTNSGDTIANSATVGSLNLSVVSTESNSPGAPDLAKLLSSSLHLTNTGTSSASIWIAFGAQDFVSPGAPPGLVMDSHIGGSVTGNTPGNLMSFQSFVDEGNGLAYSGGGIPGTLSTTVQTPAIITGSFDSDAKRLVTSLSTPYSISQLMMLTLGGHGEIGFQANTTLTPTPEPSTLAIAGLGALGLIGYGIRRRKGS